MLFTFFILQSSEEPIGIDSARAERIEQIASRIRERQKGMRVKFVPRNIPDDCIDKVKKLRELGNHLAAYLAEKYKNKKSVNLRNPPPERKKGCCS